MPTPEQEAERERLEALGINTSTGGPSANVSRETETYRAQSGGTPVNPGQTPGTGVAGAPGGFGGSEGGVQSATSRTTAGGVHGWLGGKDDFHTFRADQVGDTTTDASRALINSRIGQIGERPTLSANAATANAATSRAAQIATGPQDQFRRRQLGLADALGASARGEGPSAAQAQLQAGTDASINSALALARSGRGGNQSVALKNAMMQNGTTMQQASNASAQLRAQEQQQARGQLADVLNASRGADIGLATGQAGLTQQTSLANAGNQQQTNLANAASQTGVSQSNATLALQQATSQDEAIRQLMAQGMTLDEARMQRTIQQNQAAAELAARQEAARHGVQMQAGAQQSQAAAAGIAAVGTALASDERVKKNVSDGDDPSRKLLKRLKPKLFEYDDEHEHFGKGSRLGVMAQDVERGAPELVGTDRDGVKKIDVAKALSASLAALGSVNKRIERLESRRG